MSKKDSKLEYFDMELMQELAMDYELENSFYLALTNKDKYNVISIPSIDGSYLSEEEKGEIAFLSMKDSSALIYQIQLDNGDIIVFSVDPITLEANVKNVIGYIPATTFEFHA